MPNYVYSEAGLTIQDPHRMSPIEICKPAFRKLTRWEKVEDVATVIGFVVTLPMSLILVGVCGPSLFSLNCERGEW